MKIRYPRIVFRGVRADVFGPGIIGVGVVARAGARFLSLSLSFPEGALLSLLY
jgi:hypothetical protein